MKSLRESPNLETWRTVSGSTTFDTLREQVRERCGIVLTDRRHARQTRKPGRADPDTVSLTELQRDGLFPRPTNTKPGLYHARAADLVWFLVAALGRGHEQRDPRHTSRGRPEYERLRDELQEEWCALRKRYCRLWVPGHGWCSYDEHIARLRAAALVTARQEGPGDEAAQREAWVLASAIEKAHASQRRREIEAEDHFYRMFALRAPGMRYRIEARARDLAELVDERIVADARLALLQDPEFLEEVDPAACEIVISYRVRIGKDGRQTTRLDRPAARVRHRKAPG